MVAAEKATRPRSPASVDERQPPGQRSPGIDGEVIEGGARPEPGDEAREVLRRFALRLEAHPTSPPRRRRHEAR